MATNDSDQFWLMKAKIKLFSRKAFLSGSIKYRLLQTDSLDDNNNNNNNNFDLL